MGNEVRSKTRTFLVPRSTRGNKNEENCRNLGVVSLQLHIGDWRYGLEMKGLMEIEPWANKKGRPGWDWEENPRNTQKNQTNVIQVSLNFEICVLNLRRLPNVKQRNEHSCYVSRAEEALPSGGLLGWCSKKDHYSSTGQGCLQGVACSHAPPLLTHSTSSQIWKGP